MSFDDVRNFLILAGTLALGSWGLVSGVRYLLKEVFEHDFPSGPQVLGFMVSVVGFLSAVAGLISFYETHWQQTRTVAHPSATAQRKLKEPSVRASTSSTTPSRQLVTREGTTSPKANIRPSPQFTEAPEQQEGGSVKKQLILWAFTILFFEIALIMVFGVFETEALLVPIVLLALPAVVSLIFLTVLGAIWLAHFAKPAYFWWALTVILCTIALGVTVIGLKLFRGPQRVRVVRKANTRSALGPVAAPQFDVRSDPVGLSAIQPAASPPNRGR